MARVIKKLKKVIAEKKSEYKAAREKRRIVDAVLEPVVLGAEAVPQREDIVPPTEIVPATPAINLPVLTAEPGSLWAIKDMSGIVVVRFPSTDIPFRAYQANYDEQVAHKLPRQEVVIDIIQDFTTSVCYIHYWTPEKGLGVAYIGKDFKVEVVPATELAEMRKGYKDYILTNLSGHLGHSFKVGSDPEIFVEDEKGMVIPAFQFLKSKADSAILGADNPRTAVGTYGNLPLYWDGFQAEFETSAQNCLAWQVDSVQAGLKGLLATAKKFNPKAKLSTRTVMDIPPNMLRDAAPEHVAFGCMPSLNAYDIKGLQKGGRDVTFRPAGGHIHFGIGTTSEADAREMVKALDAILGVACVSLFQKYDDPRRRELYGLPGEFRLPPHGVEYRTLSNAWLFHPMIMNLVFDIGRKSLVLGRKGLLPLWNATEEETTLTITKCDVKKAQEILNRNKDVFFKIIRAAYGTSSTRAEWVFNLFINGMDSVLTSPSDIAANWNLEGGWVIHSDGLGKNVNLSEPIILKGNKV